jgi:hypothetical protein
MKHGLAIVVVAAVLLCGCAHAAKDPFVGTWAVNPSPGNVRIVIWKSGDHYREAEVRPSGAILPMTLTRHGDELVGTMPPPVGPTKVAIGYYPTTGLLSFESGGSNPGYEATGGDLHKLSDSTALPSPVASP